MTVNNTFNPMGYLPAGRWTVGEVKVYDEVELSDYAPVMATMQLK